MDIPQPLYFPGDKVQFFYKHPTKGKCLILGVIEYCKFESGSWEYYIQGVTNTIKDTDLFPLLNRKI